MGARWHHELEGQWCWALQCGQGNNTASLSAAFLSQSEFQLSVCQWLVLGVQELVGTWLTTS